MIVKDEYVERAAEIILKVDPSLDKERVKDIINRIAKERICDPTVVMDNNVTGDNHSITLSKMCGWIRKENPVVSGNATFYCQPTVMKSPTSNMLHNLKVGRSKIKKEMFKALQRGDMDEYAMLDLTQQNLKVIMNAEYGGSGTPTAAFYTKYSPAATTLMAQSIITTMAAFFEGYVGDNQKFFSINECFDWCHQVSLKDQKIPDWIKRHSPDEVYRRVIKHFITIHPEDAETLKQYIYNLNSNELTYMYYANNMKDLLFDHLKIQNWLHDILDKLPHYEASLTLPEEFKKDFSDVNSYNTWVSDQMFFNPKVIPEQIKESLNKFVEIMHQMIFVEYLTPDSIVKLNNHMRNTVLLVDTDSNIINSGIFTNIVVNNLFKHETFGRQKMYNEMIMINVLATALDKSVAGMLSYYARCHNIDDDAAKELTMKNEFMFRRLFLMTVKKRYVASIVLREGNIMIPFKPEIKGVNFIKAEVSPEIQKRFESILCNRILFSDELQLHEMISDLKAFEKEIREDLMLGYTKYLKTAQFKEEGAYKARTTKDGVQKSGAWTIQVFRGSTIWNTLYPNNKITAFDRVKILKLAVSKPVDVYPIRDKYPEEYAMVMKNIYDSPNQLIRESGINIICIPANLKTIPEWIIPLIDFDILISNVISSYRSILDAFKLQDMIFKTPNGDANIISCLIRL